MSGGPPHLGLVWRVCRVLPGPVIGFVLRYAYWAALVLAVGMEVTAVGIYMAYWFPAVPQWIWVGVFSAVLVGVRPAAA